MANTASTKKSTTTKTANTSTTTKAAEPVTTTVIPTEVDLNQFIVVRNGFQGHLDYISKKTGEVYEWERFGDSQDIELSELRNARSSQKAFFENNWFMFDDDDQWVIDYLGVRQYYKNSLTVDNFDSIFTKSPAEIAKLVDTMTEGQKRSLYYRSQQLIAENGIDSNKVIAALEKALGVSLIAR